MIYAGEPVNAVVKLGGSDNNDRLLSELHIANQL
jgi:hypothetical protein